MKSTESTTDAPERAFVPGSNPAATQSHALSSRVLEEHRGPLLGLCYRMLGCMGDAEDAVQETMLRAWRASDSFAGRSSVRTWLFRIGTRVCLDQLGRRRRLPMQVRSAGTVHDELDFRPADTWLEPMADVWARPDADPEQTLVRAEGVSLAWAAALQQLTPMQRACLVLADVVDLSAADIASALECSVASVTSALQRARRATRSLREQELQADPERADNRAAIEAFAEAFGRYDLEALRRLLREDTTMCMPPLALWLRGRDAVVDWMNGRGAGCRGSKIVPTHANGRPAWAQYRPPAGAQFVAWAVVVPVAHDGVVDELHFFLEVGRLFPRFGLPLAIF
jgi:RNA polymerase sigma-70 factor (ECF subfamily)